MSQKFQITDRTILAEYSAAIGQQIPEWFRAFDFSEENGDLGYRTQASAVFSSNIEGNTLDLNSYMNHHLSKAKCRRSKEVKEIDDLVAGYQFAQKTDINQVASLKAHKILSASILTKSAQGRYRTGGVGVFSDKGLVYLAIEPEFVDSAMEEFWAGIGKLLTERLSELEAFYFAALLHLQFVHIHPFADGNGRMARLLEKWFLAATLGADVWKLPSEKYYRDHQAEYYRNINLGVNYYELDYSRSLPFLEMLPHCLVS